MSYLGRSMSVNAAMAHKKGLLPLSSITTDILKEKGFTYPKAFFHWLCKQGYIRPAEFHHASASKQMIRYYDPKYIELITKIYDLENLYFLYRGKITKEELLNKRKIEYVKVLTSGSRMGLKRNIHLYCIQVDGLVLWSQYIAIDMEYSKIIENYGPKRPGKWNNPNGSKILRKIIIFKRVRVNCFR
jgi:hypothetical protein